MRVAAAVREVLARGYSLGDLRADLLAGAVVGIVALPLSMALAIASGVPPQHGLYTAIIAGGAIALLGGSRLQVSGPTAAFVVILAPIAKDHGVGGLMIATMLAGVMLLAMGLARMGSLIRFIPNPVVTGFTSGIAVVIATLQLKDFLGLHVESMPDHYVERVAALYEALPTLELDTLGIGAFTLAILLVWPRITTRVPGPLVALLAGTVAATALAAFVPGFQVDTIASRFSYTMGGEVHPGIPRLPPMPVLPWTFPGGDGKPLALSFELIQSLMGPAFAIAMLGAIESLLSAVVADGMAHTRHDSDSELVGQGIGNLIAPFFGGIAATGAIARTATNIRSGARSPFASVIHAGFVLAAVLLLAPVLGYLPMASLAALLLLVAWNMSEARHFAHMLRVAPRSDVSVLLTCFSLTVVFDMVVSVTAGVLLASVLFMRRMAEVTGARLVTPGAPTYPKGLPAGVVLYEVAGPLFFGAAQKAMGALEDIGAQAKVVVLDLRAVPAMDATGLSNLESATANLRRHHVPLVLAGVQEQPGKLLAKAGWRDEKGVAIFPFFDDAIEHARRLVGAPTPPPAERMAS